MTLEAEIQNQFKVNCAVGCSEYYFIGLDNNRILVHRTAGHQHVKTLLTKRAPLTMAILDKRLCIVGMRNHAFTAINYKNNFKMKGTTWNGDNNDWIQVCTNIENNGFYRVWEKENLTLTTLRGYGPSAKVDDVDFNW